MKKDLHKDDMKKYQSNYFFVEFSAINRKIFMKNSWI